MGSTVGNPTHPRPSTDADNMVEFWLGRTVNGVTIPGNGTPVQKVTINGHDFEVKFGARNRTPREVYEVFKNANSRNVLPDLAALERAPKPMTDHRMGGSDFRTLPDYELELLKEGK